VLYDPSARELGVHFFIRLVVVGNEIKTIFVLREIPKCENVVARISAVKVSRENEGVQKTWGIVLDQGERHNTCTCSTFADYVSEVVQYPWVGDHVDIYIE
jgi:hypothetical protein